MVAEQKYYIKIFFCFNYSLFHNIANWPLEKSYERK